MVVVPLEKGKDIPAITVTVGQQYPNNEIGPVKSQKRVSEYTLPGNSTIKVSWKA